MECNTSKNVENCKCTYMSCERRGHCCECIAYHRSKGQMVGCYFTEEGEKTYDRSMANFIKYQKELI